MAFSVNISYQQTSF